MKSRIQKWGNSLAVRIPKSFAEEAGLKNESAVNVSLVKGKLVIAPAVSQRKPTLRQLLARITDENRHQSIDTGSPGGKEIW